MSISASQVSELRRMTDCGIMDCKKALIESAGDIDKAVEFLRAKGMAKVAKTAGRVAAEGVIKVKLSEDGKYAIIIEINCETDFVAKDDNFSQFSNTVLDIALANKISDIDILMQTNVNGRTIESLRQDLIMKIGENVNVRRISFIESNVIGMYLHNNRIGVLVGLEAGDKDLAKELAMHIAASKPLVVSQADVPKDVIETEKRVYEAQAIESGKPAEIVAKMVEGRLRKFLEEVSLLGQPFVINTDITVGTLIDSKKAKVSGFVRFELGEGIEKKKANFAEEVMAQVNG